MRKSLIMLLILLLLVVVIFMIASSLSIGGFQILGIEKLGEKNKELDESIQELTKLSSSEYQKALKDVSESAKQYEATKENYEQLAEVSEEGSVMTANQLQKYEIEYLWTRIGSHATKENVILKMDVKENASSASTGYFDLEFAVTGTYVSLIDFIYDIENDSSLGFKIEDFKMTSGSVRFKCSNIAINIDPSELTGADASSSSEEGEEEEETTTETSSSNTTTTTSSDTTEVDNLTSSTETTR